MNDDDVALRAHEREQPADGSGGYAAANVGLVGLARYAHGLVDPRSPDRGETSDLAL